MHKDFERADRLSSQIIGAAIEVHSIKGPGLLESIYEQCLVRELEMKGIHSNRQVQVPVDYKGFLLDQRLVLDLIVEDCLIIELKAVESILPIHKAQLLSYMKLMNVPLGLLINFNVLRLKDGVRRMILPGSNAEEVDF